MRPTIEHTRPRGPTALAINARRQAARERARTALARLGSDLEGQDEELRVEVFREMIRALSSSLLVRVGEGRAAGVLVGALVNVSPAWRSDPRCAMAQAEAVFGGGE